MFLNSYAKTRHCYGLIVDYAQETNAHIQPQDSFNTYLLIGRAFREKCIFMDYIG